MPACHLNHILREEYYLLSQSCKGKNHAYMVFGI